MKVLITGGQGFIGKYLSRQMREMGWQVDDPGKGEIDIRNIGHTLAAYGHRHFDAVIHLAALLMINKHQPESYFITNSIGTFNMLEFCRMTNVKTFIYSMTHSDTNMLQSTDRVKMKDDPPRCFGANSWQRSENAIPFVASKIAAMDMVDAYTRKKVLRGVNLRLANIRGFGSADTKYNCVFHQFVQKALAGKDIEIWGNPPKTVRDMIYVKDIVSAIIAAIISPTAHGCYNIGTGRGMTIEDEAKAIIKVFCGEKKSQFIYRPEIEEYRKVSCVFDISKAQKELGWSPQYSYVEGLEDFKIEAGL